MAFPPSLAVPLNNGTTCHMRLSELGGWQPMVPGVYLFVRHVSGSDYWPVYVGETGDLNDRLVSNVNQHHRIADIRAERASHVATLGVAGVRQNRLDLETIIRHSYPELINHQETPLVRELTQR